MDVKISWSSGDGCGEFYMLVAVTKAKSNPALKVSGVIAFTFEELSRATSNFDDKNLLGQGGYGKVYVGDLKDGKQRVAIKRAEPGSLQGAHEFYWKP